MRGVSLVLLLSGTLYSVEVEESLKLRNENALLTEKSSLQKAEFEAELSLELGLESGEKVVAIGRLGADGKDKLRPKSFDTTNYSDASKPLALGTAGVLELRELFYEKEMGTTLLKMGKMQTVWGKADGIKLIDRLNPQDFSEFILDDFEDSRIALWSLGKSDEDFLR